MEDVYIRPIRHGELENCLQVIHTSFYTVAQEFGLTAKNCPRHTAFLPLIYLQTQFDWGWHMCGLYAGNRLIGYMSVSQESEDTCELHHLAVLPCFRRKGYGRLLLDRAKEITRDQGTSRLRIGIIEESTTLKNWYIANGFTPIGTQKYDHLPFTSGYLVWDTQKG